MKLFLFVLLYFCAFSLVHAANELCSDVVLIGDDNIKLSENEERLLCGDPQVRAYQEVPHYQASFWLTGFLQSRGYLRPNFEVKDDILHVTLGEKSHLKKVHVKADGDKVEEKTKRHLNRRYGKQMLTPALLDKMEIDAKELARQLGYPCAKVKSQVEANEDTADIEFSQLVSHEFGEVEKEELPGLEEDALARFYPYKSKDPYDERLLSLNEKRMLRSEVVQGTYYLESCKNQGKEFSLSQYFIEGPPRTVRFGVGANTEVGPVARLRWAHNRYRSMASQLTASLTASLRNQALNLDADYFLWKSHPRRSILGQFEIRRNSQIDFEETIMGLRTHVKWTADYGGHHWQWVLGPALERGVYHASVEADTNTYITGALQGGLQWTSHTYEWFDVHPEKGDQFLFNIDYRNPSLGFDETLTKLDSSFVSLKRLGQGGRGHFIGGLRLNAATTWVDDEVPLSELPPSLKHYGGGSDDLRGFLLRTLPKNDGLGALSKVGLKLELRKTHFFKESLEVYTFVDSARFGDRSWELSQRLWYSPGFGLRWHSPIGLVQTFAARALTVDPKQDLGNLYFLGLGGTF